jgi:hypothetical protein
MWVALCYASSSSESQRMNRSIIAFAALSVLVSGCSGEKPASAAQPRKPKEGSVAPRAAVVAASAQPYRAISVASPGRIAGTVEFDGVFPPTQSFSSPPIKRAAVNRSLITGSSAPAIALRASPSG